MRIVVETPRWSFVKYRLTDGKAVRELVSPLPNLFNYGFVEGTMAADGMEEDAILLGPALRAGARVDAAKVGVVRFIDDGKRDDKIVASATGGMSLVDRAKIRVFFTAYAAFKTAHYLVRGHRWALCNFGGLEKS